MRIARWHVEGDAQGPSGGGGVKVLAELRKARLTGSPRDCACPKTSRLLTTAPAPH